MRQIVYNKIGYLPIHRVKLHLVIASSASRTSHTTSLVSHFNSTWSFPLTKPWLVPRFSPQMDGLVKIILVTMVLMCLFTYNSLSSTRFNPQMDGPITIILVTTILRCLFAYNSLISTRFNCQMDGPITIILTMVLMCFFTYNCISHVCISHHFPFHRYV